jgi:hypothetical protein
MVLAIFAADEGGGFGVVEDLFRLGIEGQRLADAGGFNPSPSGATSL